MSINLWNFFLHLIFSTKLTLFYIHLKVYFMKVHTIHRLFLALNWEVWLPRQAKTGHWMEGWQSHKVKTFKLQWKVILRNHKLCHKRTRRTPSGTLTKAYMLAYTFSHAHTHTGTHTHSHIHAYTHRVYINIVLGMRLTITPRNGKKLNFEVNLPRAVI